MSKGDFFSPNGTTINGNLSFTSGKFYNRYKMYYSRYIVDKNEKSTISQYNYRTTVKPLLKYLVPLNNLYQN